MFETADVVWAEAEDAFTKERAERAVYQEACQARAKAFADLQARGLTLREIAEHFGITHPQVQRAIHRVARVEEAA